MWAHQERWVLKSFKILRDLDHQVLAATSSHLTATNDSGIERVHLDLVLQEGIPAALERADKVFLLSPPGHTDAYALLHPLILEAKKKQIKKVVLMTAMGANTIEGSPFQRLESELSTSGLSYGILRPNWFMQNFNTFWIQGIQNQGRILLPAGDSLVSFIDARDIAAAAGRLLVDDSLGNVALDLSGGEALSHEQVAHILSEVLNKPIVYQDIPSVEFEESLVRAKVPPAYAHFLAHLFELIKTGLNARVSLSLKNLLGRDPITFRQYARDYKASF